MMCYAGKTVSGAGAPARAPGWRCLNLSNVEGRVRLRIACGASTVELRLRTDIQCVCVPLHTDERSRCAQPATNFAPAVLAHVSE